MGTWSRPWWRRGFPGVWITGAGGGGLASVHTTPTLTGAGTTGSPLGLAGLPLTFFSAGGLVSNGVAVNANEVFVQGFFLPSALTFSNINVHITTADATHDYDFGIYSQAGSLLANIGPTLMPSTGFQAFPVLQAPVTLLPGLYAFALTGNAANLQLSFSNSPCVWISNGNYAASTGGTLPASVPAMTIAPAGNPNYFSLY